MFVRAKTIQGKKYGYLVHNEWIQGKVRQKTKKYLGKILKLEEKYRPTHELDFTKDKKQILRDLVGCELEAHGFTKKGLLYSKDRITVHLSTGTIKNGSANCVLQLRERYVYKGLLQQLLDFYEPESDHERPGTKLARLLSDIGIDVASDTFIQLYKKIYTNVSFDN